MDEVLRDMAQKVGVFYPCVMNSMTLNTVQSKYNLDYVGTHRHI